MQKFTEEVADLAEALSYRRRQDNPKFKYYFTDKLLIGTFKKSRSTVMKPSEHSHPEYEFIIPTTPIPYLTNNDAVYFGEVGKVYSVHSMLPHGILYSLVDVGHDDIVVNKEFFEEILREKGCEGFQFNFLFNATDLLKQMIEAFKIEFDKGEAADVQNKLEPMARILCSELIDEAVKGKIDDRKDKYDYQKGLRAAADFINIHFEKDISVDELSAICGLSPNYFSTRFKKMFGDSPSSYVAKLRVSRAKMLLETSTFTITEISTMCGFKKANSFTGAFKKLTGLTPSEYRDKFI